MLQKQTCVEKVPTSDNSQAKVLRLSQTQLCSHLVEHLKQLPLYLHTGQQG
jgi:hypothetical protein